MFVGDLTVFKSEGKASFQSGPTMANLSALVPVVRRPILEKVFE